jgi:hypothetical protein
VLESECCALLGMLSNAFVLCHQNSHLEASIGMLSLDRIHKLVNLNCLDCRTGTYKEAKEIILQCADNLLLFHIIPERDDKYYELSLSLSKSNNISCDLWSL